MGLGKLAWAFPTMKSLIMDGVPWVVSGSLAATTHGWPPDGVTGGVGGSDSRVKSQPSATAAGQGCGAPFQGSVGLFPWSGGRVVASEADVTL